MPKIFISYRREDGQAFAGRIADRLVESFGREAVFMDVDNITYGEDFVKAIEAAVAQCEVLIAVIGRNWLQVSTATGKSRLHDPNDFVRLEIADALRRNIRVISVLVENARLPSADELPEELRPLLRRNAIDVHHTSFNDDIDRLISTLQATIRRKKRRIRLLATVAVALVVGLGGFWFTWERRNTGDQAETPFHFKVRLSSADRPTAAFNEGQLVVYVGRESKKSDVRDGEATFDNIPPQFHLMPARLDVLIPGYERADSSGEVRLSKDRDYIDVQLRRTAESMMTSLRGTIVDEKNKPLVNARVNIGSGLATGITDEQGDFTCQVPLPEGQRTRIKVLINEVILLHEDVVLSATTPIQLKVDRTP